MLTRRRFLRHLGSLGALLPAAAAARTVDGGLWTGGDGSPATVLGPPSTVSRPQVPAVLRAGGMFVTAISVDPQSMDPAWTGEPQARMIRGCISEALLDLDEKGRLVPWLAESWEQTDPRTYVFRLRRGVKFHDGTSFDAEAVKFNLKRMRNPETKNVWINEIAALDTVEVVDAHTVRVTSKEPFASFLVPFYDVNGMQLSPAAVQRWGSEIGFHPVGTGPFKFVEYQKDLQTVLERNPDYWDAGKPQLDRLVFRPIPNSATRLTELRAGGVHLVEYLPFQDVERLRGSSDVIVSEMPGFRVDWLMINTEREPGSSRAFRQAWGWLIDRDAIQEVVYRNTGSPAWDLFLPGSRFYDPNYRPTTRDVGRAKALLAQSGVRLPLDITVYTTQDPVRLQEYQIIQANAAEVDINIKVEIVDTAVWNQRHRAGEYTLALSWWGYRPDPDQYLGVNLSTGGGWNWSRYSNPRMDTLIQSGRAEQDDARRLALYRELADLLTEDAPLVPYHYGSNIKGLSPKVQGFVHRVDGLVRFHTMQLG